MRKLYLTGIRGVPREALEDAFNKYGKIVKLSTGAQDFGFCDMETEEQCQECAKNLNRTEIGGRVINVEVAKDMPRKDFNFKDDDFICYNCKRSGHLARDCREKPRNPMFADTRGNKKDEDRDRERDAEDSSAPKSGRFHPYGGDSRPARAASPTRPAYDRERRYSPERRQADPYRAARPEPRDAYPSRYDDHHRDRSPPPVRDVRDPYRDPRPPLDSRDYLPPRYDDRRLPPPPLDYRDSYRRDYLPPPPRYYDRRPLDPYDRRPVDPYRRSPERGRAPPLDDRYRARSPERYRASPEPAEYADRYVADTSRDRYAATSAPPARDVPAATKYADDKYPEKRPTSTAASTKRSRSPEKRPASPERYRSSPVKERSPVRSPLSPVGTSTRDGSRSPNYRRDRSDRESRFKRSAREERASP